MSLTSVPSPTNNVTVLDSWPYVESILRSVEIPRLSTLLDQAAGSQTLLLMSEMNLGEVYYVVAKHEGNTVSAERALEAISRLPIHIVPVAAGMVLGAARLKARRQLSYADCFCAFLAIEHGAPILTGDPDFLSLASDGLVKVDWVGR